MYIGPMCRRSGDWGTIGALLGHYWGTIGALLGHYWGTIGALLGHYWGTIGVLLGDLIRGLIRPHRSQIEAEEPYRRGRSDLLRLHFF